MAAVGRRRDPHLPAAQFRIRCLRVPQSSPACHYAQSPPRVRNSAFVGKNWTQLPSMRTVLRNFETGQYLAHDGTWTEAPETAKTFLSSVGATHYKLSRRLFNTFAVLLPDISFAAEADLYHNAQED